MSDRIVGVLLDGLAYSVGHLAVWPEVTPGSTALCGSNDRVGADGIARTLRAAIDALDTQGGKINLWRSDSLPAFAEPEETASPANDEPACPIVEDYAAIARGLRLLEAERIARRAQPAPEQRPEAEGRLLMATADAERLFPGRFLRDKLYWLDNRAGTIETDSGAHECHPNFGSNELLFREVLTLG